MKRICICTLLQSKPVLCLCLYFDPLIGNYVLSRCNERNNLERFETFQSICDSIFITEYSVNGYHYPELSEFLPGNIKRSKCCRTFSTPAITLLHVDATITAENWAVAFSHVTAEIIFSKVRVEH